MNDNPNLGSRGGWPASVADHQTPQPWQDNTPANPFYRQRGPIEVFLSDNRIKRLDCPGCARMMPGVVKWRKA